MDHGEGNSKHGVVTHLIINCITVAFPANMKNTGDQFTIGY
jgi:hypothetical protein